MFYLNELRSNSHKFNVQLNSVMQSTQIFTIACLKNAGVSTITPARDAGASRACAQCAERGIINTAVLLRNR
ncbi:hypothetical protein [Pseudomonas prosekii]|jgi:hypothetical protein|uniref:hypothetical protein n=1 Tax=Pseudomonas prosekii TaxID=1148509 RepID=UPI001604E603|nr:hypothetical protein [Pseudomonas prosekii]